MSAPRKRWTPVPADLVEQWLLQALDFAPKVIELAKREDLRPTATAFAALNIIRAINIEIGGDLEWWCDLLRNGPEALLKYAVKVDGPLNFQRRGGRT